MRWGLVHVRAGLVWSGLAGLVLFVGWCCGPSLGLVWLGLSHTQFSYDWLYLVRVDPIWVIFWYGLVVQLWFGPGLGLTQLVWFRWFGCGLVSQAHSDLV